MKKLLLIFVLITNIVYAQQVSVPEPKTFAINTSGQDASGFSLSGFNSTATLLCAIGLPQSPIGTTFYLTTTTGLTPASGFTMSGNKTRLVFTGTMSNINAALATLKVNTPTASGSVQISVSATVNPAGYFYNPNNGHFYRPISTTATYSNAKLLSSQQTFKGQTGYLVTLTSADEENFVIQNVPQNNIWIALTDVVVEGYWRIDAGPEAGTLIKTSNGQLTGNITGQYNNWCGGEPNNAGNEDYAVTKWGGGRCWNDLPGTWSNPYIIEFGTWTNPDDQTFTEFYSNSVTHSNGDILRTQFTFDFGSNVDETKFSIKAFTYTDYVNGPFVESKLNTPYVFLNGLGKVDVTSTIDETKIGSENHIVLFGEYNQSQLEILYNQIVTVSDVYLAFRELSDKGLFGNESKYFTSGIQFDNADVNHDNVFDERDTYKLLQHLQGTTSLWESNPNLSYMMKLVPTTTYNQMNKDNWSLHTPNEWNRARYPISINPNLLNTYNVSVTWNGDVNLSHSAIPPTNTTTISNSIAKKTNSDVGSVIADFISEQVDGYVIATLFINPNGNNVGAIQFNLYYDKSLIDYVDTEYSNTSFVNFSKQNQSYINFGTLNAMGGSIQNIEYKIKFKPKTNLTNLLGLLAIQNIETVGVNVEKLNIKIQ